MRFKLAALRRMIGAIVLALVVVCTGPVVCRSQETVATERERLQGTWVCIASVKDGQPVNDFVGVKVKFAGTRLTWIFPLKDGKTSEQQGIYSLDPTKSPKHFDWADVESSDKPHRRLYLLAGDVLMMSANVVKTAAVNAPGQRPTSFNDGQYLFIVKREVAAQ